MRERDLTPTPLSSDEAQDMLARRGARGSILKQDALVAASIPTNMPFALNAKQGGQRDEVLLPGSGVSPRL